jgi:DNA primase
VEYVFKKRGLSKQIVQDFRIGYAPATGDALIQFLSKKGYSRQELSDAGLTNQYGGDIFRGRMTVPLMDSVGQVIGFTARTLTDDDPKAPKYLNTPQTLLYDKSRHVFGLSQAKQTIRKNDYAVIVEGNLDVISSHQVGITGVVATAGTAMTDFHLRALKRITQNVRLAFDSDKAGLAATERAIPLAEKAEVELTIITLSDDAKDPDELIQKDPALWQAAIDKPEPLVAWVLDQYRNREDLQTALGKRRYIDEALRVIRMISNDDVRRHYVQSVADATKGNLDNLLERLARANDSSTQAPTLKPTAQLSHVTTYDESSFQDNLLAAAIIDSATHELFKDIDSTLFIGEERQAVAEYIKTHGGKVLTDTPKGLQKYDTYVKILLLRADTRYADWNDQDRYFETARLLRQVQTEHMKKQKDILSEQLRDAETIGDDAQASELRAQIYKLIKEIQSGQK